MEKKKVDLDEKLDRCGFDTRTRNFIKKWNSLYELGQKFQTNGTAKSSQIDWKHAYNWFPLVTIRDLCRIHYESVLAINGVGGYVYGQIETYLYQYGLEMGMSEMEIAEYEDKPLESSSITTRKDIDWEERTWQVALVMLQLIGDVPSIEHPEASETAISCAQRYVASFKAMMGLDKEEEV